MQPIRICLDQDDIIMPKNWETKLSLDLYISLATRIGTLLLSQIPAAFPDYLPP